MTLTNEQKVEALRAARKEVELTDSRPLCIILWHEVVNHRDDIPCEIVEMVDLFNMLQFKPKDVQRCENWFPYDREGQRKRLQIIDELIEQFSKP